MRVRNDLSCTPVELPNGMAFPSITECARYLGCTRRAVATAIEMGSLDCLVAKIEARNGKARAVDIEMERMLNEVFEKIFPERFGTARKDAA